MEQVIKYFCLVCNFDKNAPRRITESGVFDTYCDASCSNEIDRMQMVSYQRLNICDDRGICLTCNEMHKKIDDYIPCYRKNIKSKDIDAKTSK